MNNSNILLILLQPFCDVLTEWFDVVEFWRVMIVKRKVYNTIIEFGWVVTALGRLTQIIYFKMILMFSVKESFDIVHGVFVKRFKILGWKAHSN